MCGIVYAHNFDGSPVNNAVLQQFDLQRHRGTEGFGIYDGQELNMVHATTENKILKWLCRYDSNLLLMHHRYPTSTANVKRAAHPFSTKDYYGDTEYILVHNGVIKNAGKLFEEHQTKGMPYQSLLDNWKFNDSESLLWEFAEYMEGNTEKLGAYGDIAFVALKKYKGELVNMYFGRNTGRPLHLHHTNEHIELSSEGQGVMVMSDYLYDYSYAANTLTQTPLAIREYPEIVLSSHRSAQNWDDDDEFDFRYGYYPYSGSGTTFGDPDDEEFDELKPAEEEPERKFIRTAISRVLGRRNTGDVVATEKPSKAEIEVEALNYISTYMGHFEQAYWAVECDYEDILNQPASQPNLFRKALLEGVMRYIDADPEYLHEESVSSLWQSAQLAFC